MNVIMAQKNVKEEVTMRDEYCKTLIELAEKNNNVVLLEADLMAAMSMGPFAEKFPNRTFNCGIQEQNMVGVAAGLSATGKIPYAHTFAVFATRRAYDQVFLACSYSKQNVRIIGSDPGVSAAFNGGTHMPFEDIGIMRNIPDITIIEPVDSVMMKDIIKQSADIYGVFYIRLFRNNAIKIYEEGSNFEIGKAVKIREGRDVTIIATGILTAEAIKAADILSDIGISARVLNMFTIKPIDKEAIIKSAEETGAIVTAENHNIINGLGSAVAEVLIENKLVPMERVGVEDIFGEVGPLEYLQEKFDLTAEDIVKKVKKAIERKNK